MNKGTINKKDKKTTDTTTVNNTSNNSMSRRTFVEFVTAWVLIAVSVVIMILPIFNIMNVRNVFVINISLYGIIHLIKNFAILTSKDYSGFSSSFISVILLILTMFIDVNENPWNLALLLFIWVILMSLNKLKESDYYHDRKNKLWELNIVNLILFILAGILTTLNLNQPGDMQILLIGFFFLINGILELMDPLVAYLISKK